MSGKDEDDTRMPPTDRGGARTRLSGSRQRGDTTSRAATDPDARTRVATSPPDAGAGARRRAEGTEPPGTTTGEWARPELWEEPSSGPVGPGAVIKERFVLEDLIGHGGMGTVYRARDLRKEEAGDRQPHIALKLLNEDFRQHPDALVALQREAKKAQTLAHPDIVTVYDFDRDGTRVFMTMEYLDGDPLDVVIRRRGAMGGLPRAEALHIIERMARGLAYAHEKGIVHSDFKPGNVIVTAEGNPKILDFGIARAARVGQAGGGDQTRFDPASLGAITPAYASAEMLAGEVPEAVDDVYALACVAHELLTGRHPFVDASGRKLPAHEAAAQGLTAPVLRDVPRRVARAVIRGLAFKRADRVADAGAFLEMLRPPVRAGRLVVSAAAVLLVVAAVSWWMLIRESDFLVTLDDLPPALAESRELIIEGNRYFDEGDVSQAYRYYALAWERGEEAERISSRERNRLRVIVDRRTDAVVDHYISESRRDDLQPFDLELVQLSLESLQRSELGTSEERIEAALEEVDGRLDELRGRQ